VSEDWSVDRRQGSMSSAPMHLAPADETNASLQLVAREIAAELNEARLALEAYAERPEERGLLDRFAGHLHLGRGALRIAEVYGGSLLAEEMEHVAQYVARHADGGKVDADGLDALMRAMEQLPAYLDRVASGGRDVPLALLPLLNDLRAVRGGALLSEGTLLLLNLRSDEPARPIATGPGSELAGMAKRLRPRFQKALLGWIRAENVDQQLGAMSEVAEQFETASASQPLFQLWWVVGSVIEALRQRGLDSSVSVKRLLGQVDRELRRLQEAGEERYSQSPPLELLNNLLFYVARATTQGPRVTGVRRSFRLDELLPVDERIDEARETLSAPSVRLMRTVAAAIREDLTRVKDVLDIFVRKGATQVEDLVPQLEMLRKISDTLGVLGLGALRDRVQGEIESLRAIVDRQSPPGDAVLLGIAAALIEVEDSLDGQLVRLILPEAGPKDAKDAPPQDEEFRQVQDAVLRECIVNMARIKEAVTQALGAPAEAQGLDQVPQLVRGITAGLLMLGRQRAVEVMEGIGHALGGIMRPEPGALAPHRLERMADAIVAVEYYMEMLQAGRPDHFNMLENAETCLTTLEHGKVVSLRGRPGEPAAPTVVAPLPSVIESVREMAATPATAPPPARPAVPAVRGDSEFVHLFVEEARENVARIAELFPQWEQNPLEIEALREVRRSFHTLKGSGRMVGALRLGEFAWSIENLLNRVLSQTLARSPEIVAVLRDAVAILPVLVDELEYGSPSGLGVDGIAARADALSGREPSAATAAVAAPRAPAQADAVAAGDAAVAESRAAAADELAAHAAEPAQGAPAAAPEVDLVLQDIFRKETAGHVAAVRDYIERRMQDTAPHPVTDALYRACHTLSGIAKTAGVRQGIKVAEPMEHYVRKLHDVGHGLPAEGLALLNDTVRALENVVDHFDEDTGFFPDHRRLIVGWHALERSLDAELKRISELAESSSIPPGSAEFDAAVEPLRPSMAATPSQSAAVPRTPSATNGHDATETPQPDAEFDADIAGIFSEEANELLEQADAALGRWSGDRADGGAVVELKRLLHTLKGGARMAGLRAMGDLSHEMESVLTLLESGSITSDGRTIAALQAALDGLHQMRDAASGGQAIPPSAELIARVRAIGSREPRAAADEGAASAPATRTTHRPPPPAPTAAVAPPAAIEPPPVPTPAIEPAFVPAASRTGPGFESPAFERRAEPAPPAWDEPVEGEGGAVLSVPTPALPGREPVVTAERQELARVDADLLDDLLNNAGEVSIFRARVEQQMTSVEFNLAELERTVTRLREQLRKLELETEAMILHRHQDAAQQRTDFDPLELDRYSTIQQFSRALAESVSDVASIEGLLGNLTREGQNLLLQQGRIITELQNGLMKTRMVPFQRHVQRLTRLVRQTAQETGKKVELAVEGGSGELDRQVLERMLPPFEHMLRNSVVHGIESPADRTARGKPETGTIAVRLQREGAEVVIVVEDDGAGLDVSAIRGKARQLGLLRPEQTITDEETLQLILEPGFSTAERLTQQAGRGVGMDVVATEVKKLGGGLFIESNPGRGARFTIRLPFTLAITQALIVRVHDEHFALPVATVEGVARLPRSEVAQHLSEEVPSFEYGGQVYRFQYLGAFVGSGASVLPENDVAIPVILVRAGEHSAALVTDELIGSREIVVKSLGPQIAGIRGISGATILGDGRIVVILDMGALVRSEWRARPVNEVVRPSRDDRIFALVVDDSITVRRVTQRLLERNGMRVMTAKDGVDAMSLLQEHVPDMLLLDIEMPRMDGYEVASLVRNDARLADVPIIMITSRVGDKHRARAIELGVDDYLGKPYQESQLLDAIEPLVLARRQQAD
jgi:chemosensory pili system protein ChpA (sensor histidine kinase/response regulator)